MKIRVGQVMCHRRHPQLGMVINSSPVKDPDAKVREGMRAAVELALQGQGARVGLPHTIRPFCRLCGAGYDRWIFEVLDCSPFFSWEECREAFKAFECRYFLEAPMARVFGIKYDEYCEKEMQSILAKANETFERAQVVNN